MNRLALHAMTATLVAAIPLLVVVVIAAVARRRASMSAAHGHLTRLAVATGATWLAFLAWLAIDHAAISDGTRDPWPQLASQLGFVVLFLGFACPLISLSHRRSRSW